MAKITDPDNLFYSEYTFNTDIDPAIALDGGPANMLIDYENRKFALTAPRFGQIGLGISEMVGYAATGGVTGQALYSKFKNIWKDDPVAVRFPFPMEAITPESFEFINGWLPDDQTVSLQSGVNTSFITRKLIKDTGWAERTLAGNIARRYFGAITLGALTLGPAGVTTVYYNAVNPGLQTSITIDTNGSIDADLDAVNFDGIVGNGNTFSSAPYFYTGDAIVYQNDGTEAVAGLTTNGIYYIRYLPDGQVPTGVGHSFTLHNDRLDALTGINTVDLTGSTTSEVITFTAAGVPEEFFFGIVEEGTAANEPIQFFATADDDGTTVLYNRDNYYRIFAREEQKSYAVQDIGDIGVSQLNFQAYRFPLATANDINVTIADGDGTTTGIATADYAGIGISFFDTPQTYQIGDQSYNFNIVINANQQPLTEVYSKVQYLLRQPIRTNAGAGGTDINSLSAVGYDNGDGAQTLFENAFRYGAVEQPLLEFIGNDLYVRRVEDVFNVTGLNADVNNLANVGVFIADVADADLNSVYFFDNGASPTDSAILYPFVAAGNLVFNENFTGDGDSKYWMFYDLPSGTGVNAVIPGLTTALSQEAGTDGTTPGIINATNEFTVGAGNSHPFVLGQKVVAIGTAIDIGIGIALTDTFNPLTQQGLTTAVYYVNSLKDRALGIAQTYSDVEETGTNSPGSQGNRVGFGLTTAFRLHYRYSDAVANNNLGINTIALTASATAGVVTFTQLDVNFSEANATLVQNNDGVYLDAQPISASEISFSYDYDNNSQRNRVPSGGQDASGVYAPVVRVVAVGLETGQYASATAQISRTKGQTINVTGALERVYNDPN